MKKLHSINKSPSHSSALATCLASISAQSAIIFIEDGVYAALANYSDGVNLIEKKIDIQYYALQADLEARGLSVEALDQRVEVVDYMMFVDLVEKLDGFVAWS